jgi:hypothetical protein
MLDEFLIARQLHPEIGKYSLGIAIYYHSTNNFIEAAK